MIYLFTAYGAVEFMFEWRKLGGENSRGDYNRLADDALTRSELTGLPSTSVSHKLSLETKLQFLPCLNFRLRKLKIVCFILETFFHLR